MQNSESIFGDDFDVKMGSRDIRRVIDLLETQILKIQEEAALTLPSEIEDFVQQIVVEDDYHNHHEVLPGVTWSAIFFGIFAWAERTAKMLIGLPRTRSHALEQLKCQLYASNRKDLCSGINWALIDDASKIRNISAHSILLEDQDKNNRQALRKILDDRPKWFLEVWAPLGLLLLSHEDEDTPAGLTSLSVSPIACRELLGEVEKALLHYIWAKKNTDSQI